MATLLSRIFGFIRDMVMAWFLGAGFGADAFFVAFRIPNLLRRLLAEGSLTVAFVPVFTGYLTRTGKAEALHLAKSAVRVLSVLLAATALLGIVLSPLIVRVVAPGFYEIQEKFLLTVTLTRIMFPYIIFIGLAALAMGILNAFGHFAAPALSPVLLNLSMIGAVFLISPYLSSGTHPGVGIAVGVLIGGMLQLAFHVPFLTKKGLTLRGKTRFYHPGLKRIGALMIPGAFGAAVYQINVLVGTMLASLLPEGSVSYLYYSDRLVQFPLGIFAVAIATAVLPSLSKQAALGEIGALKETFAYALRLVFFVTVPAMVGLIVLREPIVTLLFKRGAFDLKAARLTADALLYYAVGLWAFSGVRVVYSTFYALQDAVTPVKMALVSIAANIALGIVLMQYLLHGGLALAASLASMINFGLLLLAMRRKVGAMGLRAICLSMGRTVLCAGVMSAVIWSAGRWVLPLSGKNFSVLFIGLIASIVAGIAAYGVLSYLLKSPELETLRHMVVKGVNRQ